MNRKHLAAIIVTLLIVVFFQLSMTIRARLSKIEKELLDAETSANSAAALLVGEQAALKNMQDNSAEMLEFLNRWGDAMSIFDTPDSGELAVAARVKDAELVTLSQRFEVTKNQNESIPRLIRAHLTFEDDYAKTLNWIGAIESEFPSSRVTSLKIIRGETGNDIRATLVLDLPLPLARITGTP